MSLISPAALTALSNIVKLGMTTDVLIYDHSTVDTDDGSEERWTARSAPVKGWLYTQTQPVMTVGNGREGLINDLRLYLELGTVIDTGDRVEIEGETMTVEDTTKENTIQAMLTVRLKRIG